MRRFLKQVVAALLAAAAITTPALAEDDEGKWCSTYAQVESDATGGDYVGGLLVYETMATVARSEPSTTTTVATTTTVGAGVPGGPSGSSSQTVTVTSTQPGETITAGEPVGYYAMNDGSVYQVNCVTGEDKKISDPKDN